MSAPFEVWIDDDGDRVINTRGEYFAPDLVRYLRADLTCGECAKQGNAHKCDHTMNFPVGEGFGQLVPAECWPACMAFAPKVKP